MRLEVLLAYSGKVNRGLEAFLSEHPEILHKEFSTLSSFNSIGKLIAHSIGAERRWVGRWIQGHTVDRYEDRAAVTLEGLFKDQRAARDETLQFLASCSDLDLARPITFDLPLWNIHGVMTVEESLFHVLNHETYHRGQISMALQQWQIDPPNFDYPFFLG
jgi:uncharacterized damage-inducible protein DinB